MAKALAIRVVPKTYINPHYLNDEPISIGFPGSFLRRYVHSIIESETIRPEIRHTLKSISLMYALAENGLASAVIFESYFLGRENVMPYYYLDSPVGNSIPIALAWRKDSDSVDLADDLVHVIRRYTAVP